MEMSKTETSEAILEAAKALAVKLGLEEDKEIISLNHGQTALLVTDTGIHIGKVTMDTYDVSNVRVENYHLNGDMLLFVNSRLITENGPENWGSTSRALDVKATYSNRV